jgi:branched-chain amino acid transport system ATP-binding protein
MNNPAPKSPLLQIAGLSHSFGGLVAVSDFNLSIDPNVVWGIIGPNGAGKTTVFNLVTGVFKPDRGSVVLLGEETTGMASHRIVSKGISRTFQNIRMFRSMTVLDNLKTGGYCRLSYPLSAAIIRTSAYTKMEREITDEAMTLLDAFGLANRADEIASSLPYGLQRKVELCRALISKPAVLLLDEPGAGMNPTELDGLAFLVEWVKKHYNVAIILIEHRMRLVMNLCEYVKVLNFGKTIFTGRPRDLAADEAVVKAYFGEGHDAAFD